MAALMPIDKRLTSLSRQIVRARVLYDLWWLYAAKEFRDPFRPAFERYGELFQFLEHGLFIAAVVQAAIPFDRSKGTLSLWRAIRDLEGTQDLSQDTSAALKARLHQVAPVEKGIRVLRNNAFAHLTHALTYDEVFTKAGVRPKDIRLLIDEAMAVICILLTSRNLEPVEPNEFPAQDGLSLLEDILGNEQGEGCGDED